MDKRSPEGVAEEWRVYWLSGQAPWRTSIGAPSSVGGGFFLPQRGV